MANRIPLVVDVLDSNKIKELPVGDNLDLGGAGVTNAGTINATDIRINNVSFNNPFSGDYNDLTNKPSIPTVPSALSAFANDVGYLAAGITTDVISEGVNNEYFTLAKTDARVNAQTGSNLDLSLKTITALKDVDDVTVSDDGKILYYDHASTSWKWKVDAGGITTLPALTDVDAVTGTNDGDILYYDHATTSFKWKIDASSFTFSVGADDSTLRAISTTESIKFIGGTGITTASDSEGNITTTIGNLGDLVDVGVAGATNGQVLTYDSGASTWGPGSIAAPTNIDDLADVDTATTTPVDDYVLSFKGATSKWEPRVLNNVDAATVTTAPDATAAAQFVTFVAVSDASGQELRTDASITYNPNTNVLSATSFTGTTVNTTNLNVSGSVANGVNEITFTGDLKVASTKEIRYYDTDNSHFIGFKSAGTVTASKSFILPDGDGTTNQVLTTDGNETLSWSTPSGTGELNEDSYKTIKISGQTDVVASSAADELTLVAGTNITITTAADEITINSTGGGGGTPGGSDTQVQFNDSSSFGGDAGLVYNKTTDTLTGINIVATTVTADSVVSSGAGIPTITSASNLILDAANAVVVQAAPLRLGSFDTTGIAGLVGQPGDVIYNNSDQQLVFWNGSIWAPTNNNFSFSVGADDSTLRTISTDESIKFIGGTNVTTASDTEGNITINASGGGGGGWTEIESDTPTTQTLTWSTLNLAAYSVVRLEMEDVVRSANTRTELSISNDGFSSIDTWTQHGMNSFDNSGTFVADGNSTLTGGNGEYVVLTPHAVWASPLRWSGYIDFRVNGNAVVMTGQGISTDDGPCTVLWSGMCAVATFTDLKLHCFNGTFSSGTFRLLGMA
jgi:hypothetical protein